MGSQTDSSGASGIEPNLGLLGRKIGMMRIFSDDGESIPVTVIDVSNNRVSQIKTAAADGYSAVQVVHGERRASRVTKAAGRPLRQGRRPGRHLARRVPRLGREGRRPQGRRGRSAPTCSSSASTSTCRACRRARASPAPSSATTSGPTARRTATRVRTTCRARSAWRRIRAACSPARRCPGQMGNVTKHRPEPDRRARRRRARPAAGSRCRPRLQGRRRGGDAAVKMRLKPIKAAPVAKPEDTKAAKAPTGAKPAAKPAGKAKG